MIRTRRPPRPLDPQAVQIANSAVWNAPDFRHLHGRRLTMEPRDLTARIAWINAYLAALGKNKKPQPPRVVLEPIQPCCATGSARPAPEPAPCSGKHPCRNQGLDLKENRDEYIEDMREIKGRLMRGEITAAKAFEEMQDAANKQLLHAQVPRVTFGGESGFISKPDFAAAYNLDTHKISVNTEVLDKFEKIDPNMDRKEADRTFDDFAGVLYEEARHAEQIQRAADYAAGMGHDMSDFSKPVRESAEANMNGRNPSQYRCGKAIYDSVMGKDSEHRRRVLGPEETEAHDKWMLASSSAQAAQRDRGRASAVYGSVA